MENKLICVQTCSELDCDNVGHCVATKESIREKEGNGFDYCPCGNSPIWEEFINDKYQ